MLGAGCRADLAEVKGAADVINDVVGTLSSRFEELKCKLDTLF